jgi:hypothetical protein
MTANVGARITELANGCILAGNNWVTPDGNQRENEAPATAPKWLN